MGARALMSVSVFAPASIGNVSVGFDVLGLAVKPVDGYLLGDVVTVEEAQKSSLQVVGDFADKLPKDPKQNISWDCLALFNQALAKQGGQVKEVALTLNKNMPVGSGLGSSACSVVATLEALNQFYGSPFSKAQMLFMMGEMEAQISGSLHYDNVAPCYYGGLQLMVPDSKIICRDLPAFKETYWIMAYPGIEVSTKKAREALPLNYSRSDLITYGQRLATFVDACHRGEREQAFSVLSDVVAEPYRLSLLPKFEQAKDYLTSQEVLAVGISGSGPTLFAVVDNLAKAERLKAWLEQNYLQTSTGFCHICLADEQGAVAI
jgi:homoserine kinase